MNRALDAWVEAALAPKHWRPSTKLSLKARKPNVEPKS